MENKKTANQSLVPSEPIILPPLPLKLGSVKNLKKCFTSVPGTYNIKMDGPGTEFVSLSSSSDRVHGLLISSTAL